jgi:hypothetical protein
MKVLTFKGVIRVDLHKKVSNSLYIRILVSNNICVTFRVQNAAF